MIDAGILTAREMGQQPAGDRGPAHWARPLGLYAALLATVALATWFRELLTPTLGAQFPFILYFPVVIGAAWWGGPRQTLTVLAASVPLAVYFFIPPLRSMSVANWGGWVAVGIYVMIGLGLTIMSWRRLALEASRARFATELLRRDAEVRLLTDALPGMMATVDRGLRFELVNRFAQSWYGLPEARILGRPVVEVVGPEAFARIEPHLQDALAGRSVRFEERLRYLNGDERWVEASCVPRFDGAGQVIGVYVLATDITQRRSAEQALRDSEERFRQLADAMPQIVWTAGPDGRIDYLNRRWYEYVGPLDTGRHEPFSRFHPEDSSAASGTWEVACRERTPYDGEVRLRSAAGTYRWFLVRAVPVKTTEGEVIKWFGTFTDIDDQKQTESRLARAVADLNRSNKELEDFAYLTSHDLKEPIRGIRSYTSFVLEDTQGKLDSEVVRKLTIIERLGDRMDRLIGILLYYTQVGRAELSISQTDLGALVGNVVESQRTAIAAANAEVKIAGPLPLIECDRTRVAEVYRHLIANAIRFNTSGRPLVELGTRGTDRAGWPVLFVRDNGIGIPPEHYQTVFRMFKRLHGREEYGGGMGAGLPLVKKIVERHGGTIWIEPAPGGGTTFCFTLGSRAHAVNAAHPDR